MNYSPMRTITTVMKREMAVAFKTKSMLVLIGLLLLIAIAGPLIISFFADDDEPDTIATVGMDEAAFASTSVDTVTAQDRAAAEQLIDDEEADAALVPSEQAAGGWDLLTKGSASQSVTMAAQQAAETAASAEAYEKLNINPQDIADATPSSEVHEVDVEGSDGGITDQNFVDIFTVFIATFVVMMSIMTFAGLVGARVTEEKSSRVVEIILSSVRPVDFLAGKLLGNCLIGFAATVLIVVAGAASVTATGLVTDFPINWPLIGVMLLGELLGLLFFSCLYAAAGSLVRRTEDLQSTQTPVLMLVLATFYVPLFGWQHAETTLMNVMGWVPPVSTVVAPLEVAAGQMSWGELAASYLILALATAGVIWIVARIYQRAILNNGSKMTWKQALTK